MQRLSQFYIDESAHWTIQTKNSSTVNQFLHLAAVNRLKFDSFPNILLKKKKTSRGKMSSSIWVRVLKATCNNISFILWWPVLLVEETGVPRENHRQTSITYCCIEYTLPWMGFELTTLVVIGTVWSYLKLMLHVCLFVLSNIICHIRLSFIVGKTMNLIDDSSLFHFYTIFYVISKNKVSQLSLLKLSLKKKKKKYTNIQHKDNVFIVTQVHLNLLHYNHNLNTNGQKKETCYIQIFIFGLMKEE